MAKEHPSVSSHRDDVWAVAAITTHPDPYFAIEIAVRFG
jgi:hypothetical protein